MSESRLLDLTAYLQKLTEACEHYQPSAPTVCAHCDEMYARVGGEPEKVTLAELLGVQQLWLDGWEHPHYAANRIYHLRERVGLDVTGHIGF